MVLLLVFMQLTRDLFAIAKFLLGYSGGSSFYLRRRSVYTARPERPRAGVRFFSKPHQIGVWMNNISSLSGVWGGDPAAIIVFWHFFSNIFSLFSISFIFI